VIALCELGLTSIACVWLRIPALWRSKTSTKIQICLEPAFFAKVCLIYFVNGITFTTFVRC
jgi:hypothetical protein